MSFNPVLAIELLITGVLSALLGVLFLAVLQRKTETKRQSVFLGFSDDAEYLFDGEVLVDATPTARNLLPASCRRGAAVWPGLMRYLEQRFPEIGQRLAQLTTETPLIMTTAEEEDGELLLRVEYRGGLTRILLTDTDSGRSAGAIDPLTRRAIREELDQLRTACAKAPLPIWREARNGDVIWANAEYLDLATRQLAADEDLTWPLPRLFDHNAEQSSRRQKIASRLDRPDNWFELFAMDDAETRLVYALPANKAVKAEDGLRAFMQTLTKTFAHLSTGLAIFDQTRKLVLFNPALIDLTALTPDVLSARPTLSDFFDALRESSMIPVPRDYKSWRDEITNIEQAAASGLYEETWSLPGGQTYRVTGRPHPNGALALSFEDISNEMSQTRRYRADLELGQAVIDDMDEAIAVFSSAGALVMSNTAYSLLWHHDPASTLGSDGTISAVCTYWRDGSAPSTIWDRVEDYVATTGPREAWHDDTRLTDGRLIHCRFSPLSGGATLIAFRLDSSVRKDSAGTFTTSRKTA